MHCLCAASVPRLALLQNSPSPVLSSPVPSDIFLLRLNCQRRRCEAVARVRACFWRSHVGCNQHLPRRCPRGRRPGDSARGSEPPRANLHSDSFSPRAFAPRWDDASWRRDQSVPLLRPSPLSSSFSLSVSYPSRSNLARSGFPRGASAPGQIGRRCSAASLACSARSAPCLNSRDIGARAVTSGPDAVVSSSPGCFEDDGEGARGDAGMQRRRPNDENDGKQQRTCGDGAVGERRSAETQNF